MADIHILEGCCNHEVGGIQAGNYRVVFHVPILTPKPEVRFPDFHSVVPNITPTELDALRTGTIVEIIEIWNYTSSNPISEYQALLKARWAKLAVDENKRYNYAYKYYLITLSR